MQPRRGCYSILGGRHFGGVAVSGLPILPEVISHSCSVSKPIKLIGSPSWTQVEPYIGLLSVPYQG